MATIVENISGKNLNFMIGSGLSSMLFPTLAIRKGVLTLDQVLNSEKIGRVLRDNLLFFYYIHWILPMDYTKMQGHKNFDQTLDGHKSFIESVINLISPQGTEKPIRANFFTTNYDLLLEAAFDSYALADPNCHFNDGGKGFFNRSLSIENYHQQISSSGIFDTYRKDLPTINLYKIHGSISWNKESNNRISISASESVLLRKVNYIARNYSKTKYHRIANILFPTATTKNENSGTDYIIDQLMALHLPPLSQSILKLINSAPIINPHNWKFRETVFDQHYYQLIRELSYQLEKPHSVLISIGTSFPDDNINEIFRRSLSNPTLLVYLIAYDEQTKTRLKSMFGDYKNVRFLPENKDLKDDTKGDLNFLIQVLQGLV